jgi:hypothetical protein
MTDRAIREEVSRGLADDGERLATIDRGSHTELHIGPKEFKGHRFIRLQEWAVNPHNAQWWPSKGKGCSIKLRELEQVVAALVAGQQGAKKGTLGEKQN